VAAAKYIDIEAENLEGYRAYKLHGGVGSQATKNRTPRREGSGGGVAFPAKPDNITNFLKWAMGSVSSSVAGGTAYIHTFKMGDSVKSFTARVGREVTEEIFAGMLVDSLVLSFGESDLMVAARLIGAQLPSKAAIGAPTFSSLGSFTFAQNTVKIAGGAVVTVEGAQLGISRGISDYRVCGSPNLPRIVPQKRVVGGSMVLDFVTTTEYDRFIADTTTTLQFKFVGPAIGATGFFYTVQIDMANVGYMALPLGRITDRTRMQATASFIAMYDATDTELKIQVTNEETTI